MILTASSSVLTKTKLTKLTRFKEQKILIIFDFRTHPEVKRLIDRNADIRDFKIQRRGRQRERQKKQLV